MILFAPSQWFCGLTKGMNRPMKPNWVVGPRDLDTVEMGAL